MRSAEQMLEALLAGTLPPEAFSHRDHLAVAHAALCRFEFFEASQRVATSLHGLARRAGVPEKYSATITLAYMCLIAERMGGAREETEAFLAANPDLAAPGLLARWYSAERLQSDLARAVPVMPDLCA